MIHLYFNKHFSSLKTFSKICYNYSNKCVKFESHKQMIACPNKQNNPKGITMEIERKFLIKELPDLTKFENKHITQGYLNTNPVVRVREDGEEYYLTYKGKGLLAREEANLPLTKEAFEHLIEKSDGKIIRKTRYLIPLTPYTIELDVFEGDHAPLIMAEVEFPSVEEANAFVAPDWFGEDVTQNPKYHNSNMI